MIANQLHTLFRLTPLALCLPLLAQANTNTSTNKDTMEHIDVVYKRSSITSEITENTEKLVTMPGAMGDPLRAVFALPGVVAAGGGGDSIDEGSGGAPRPSGAGGGPGGPGGGSASTRKQCG